MPAYAQLTWQEHTVQIVRSARRRKTIQLQIRQPHILCRAPQHSTDADILRILEQKSAWLLRQLQRPPATPKRYADGEMFHYLGDPYRLRCLCGTNPHVQRTTDQLIVTVPETTPAQIRAALTDWYLRQAWEKLPVWVAHYQGQISVSPKEILIKSYKTRWGTCYADGRLSFDWRIILAPPEIVDYVVIHELCHLIHLNHSAQFWQLVQQYHPDYQAARDWLKQHGNKLQI